MRAGEDFGGSGLSKQWADGAFVYLFDESLSGRDCIYILQSEPPDEQRLRENMRKVAAEVAARSANKKEAALVDELYGNDMLAQLQRTVAAAPVVKARKIGTLGPFKPCPVADMQKVRFMAMQVSAPRGLPSHNHQRQPPAHSSASRVSLVLGHQL